MPGVSNLKRNKVFSLCLCYPPHLTASPVSLLCGSHLELEAGYIAALLNCICCSAWSPCSCLLTMFSSFRIPLPTLRWGNRANPARIPRHHLSWDPHSPTQHTHRPLLCRPHPQLCDQHPHCAVNRLRWMSTPSSGLGDPWFCLAGGAWASEPHGPWD